MNCILIFFCNKLNSIYYEICIGDNRQKSITLTIVFGLFFCISGAFGQNTTIIFNTKANVKIAISKEIDDAYTRTLTDKINTDTTGSCIYSWDVNDFQFVDCSFHDGWNAYFPIMQGAHLTITYKGEGKLEFTGVNKAEIEYYTNDYKQDIIHPYLDSLFNFSTESSIEDFSSLIEKYDWILLSILDSLVTENIISPKFSNIVKNDFHTLIACTGIGVCRTRYLENSETKATKIINGILDKVSPMIDSGDILKYSLGQTTLAMYYDNKYKHLNEKDKEELLSKNAWASYLNPDKLGYLIAPEEFQYKLLSLELLGNYENAVTKGNSILLDYISEIRSQNTFLPYLKEKQDELEASINVDHNGVKYIENIIYALEDLSKVDDFDQKVLYIDMWATWCGPCIGEFKHKDKIHELLSNYKDIIPVYISIDDDNNDIIWKEKTEAFNLNGYHLRANKELITDINEKLYEGVGIGVPRYILLGKDGNILEKNLSRPSNIDKLKLELDKHFD